MICMYILVVYDVAQERVSKIMKICREYLDHVQNSVFEGEITSAGFKELESRLKKVINEESDSILIYELWQDSFKRRVLGIEKRKKGNFI